MAKKSARCEVITWISGDLLSIGFSETKKLVQYEWKTMIFTSENAFENVALNMKAILSWSQPEKKTELWSDITHLELEAVSLHIKW